MRKALVASATLGLMVAFGSPPAMAKEYPFCIKGCDFGAGPGDCTFVSYQQCQATAAGRTASCGTNPYYHGVAETPGRPNMSRRSF